MLDSRTNTLSWFSSSLGISSSSAFQTPLPFTAYILAILTSLLLPQCHTIFWLLVLVSLCLKKPLLLSWQIFCHVKYFHLGSQFKFPLGKFFFYIPNTRLGAPIFCYQALVVVLVFTIDYLFNYIISC